MIKFNKEEISLCKQVVERYRKPIDYGDWYWTKDKVRNNADSKWVATGYSQTCIPLWTISDCISWLREKGFYLSINTLGEYWTCLAYKHIFNEDNKDIGPRIFFQEKTLLSVLLKIILAVVEEVK